MDFVEPMMELLKLLGTLGAYSLAVAITAIVGILVFKLTQLVSILLLIKYGLTRLFDWMTHKKVTILENNTTVTLEKHIITYGDDGNSSRLLELINRLKCIQDKSNYLQKQHLEILEEGIKYLEDKYGTFKRVS